MAGVVGETGHADSMITSSGAYEETDTGGGQGITTMSECASRMKFADVTNGTISFVRESEYASSAAC